MFFFILNMVHPDTRAGLSDINMKMETMSMSQFNHEKTKANLKIAEWTNDISIEG